MRGPDALTVTVSQLNELVKMTLDSAEYLSGICVRGEISNFKGQYQKGHLYFSLKDECGAVRCVMFASNAAKLRFSPENGMKVAVTGRVSVYVQKGDYQIYIDSMEPDGIGSLAVAYEQLKEKLNAEGLFAQSHKKPLPEYPETIGVITSPTGAAVHDIITTVTRRYPLAKIVIFPSLVQGEGAAKQLASGIRYFNRTNSCDVIIIGRGGGSLEDLWEFNDETLARTIYESEIPVISAVGHDVDYTICDFVADVRAATPTAAAELAVPDSAACRALLAKTLASMTASMTSRIRSMRQKVEAFASRRCLKSATFYVDDKRMALLGKSEALEAAFLSSIERYRHTVSLLNARLQPAQAQYLGKTRAVFSELQAKLDALSPLAVFRRGYSATFREDGTLVTQAKSLHDGDRVTLRFTDGEKNAQITQ